MARLVKDEPLYLEVAHAGRDPERKVEESQKILMETTSLTKDRCQPG